MSRLGSRRQLLRSISSALALFGIGPARAATPDGAVPVGANRQALGKVIGTLRDIPLRGVQRVDAAEKDGWWARDGTGQLWLVTSKGGAQRVVDGFTPTGALATGQGRVAGLGLDGRLWVHDTTRPTAPPTRSDATL